MTLIRINRYWLVPVALTLSGAPAWSEPALSASAASPAAPASPAPPASAASAPAPDTAPAWRIHRDQPISQALEAWAERAGWVLQWDSRDDWLAPQITVFRGDFVAAAKALVKVLAAEGADIRATFYQGNKTLVIRAGANHE